MPVPKSLVPCFSQGRIPLQARTHHSFGGSFSAGSKPIFASKYAFCSVFQNLQENHLLASKFCKFLLKNCKILQKNLLFFPRRGLSNLNENREKVEKRKDEKEKGPPLQIFAFLKQTFAKFAREKIIFL